jgi:hypothetical protein
VSAFSRSFVASTLRAGRGGACDEAHTVLVHADKDALCGRLGIADEHTIHLFLLDPAGRVCWRAADAFEASGENGLRTAIARIVPRAH